MFAEGRAEGRDEDKGASVHVVVTGDRPLETPCLNSMIFGAPFVAPFGGPS